MRLRWMLPLVLLGVVGGVWAEDWPEWRGSGRRGVWNETGVARRFPKDGLTTVWRAPLGEGYAGPAVAGGRVFVTDFERGEGLRGTERALAFDEKSGRRLWVHGWPVDYTGTQPKWASGPRATPTVDGDRVYVVGAAGHLWCLDVETGKPRWDHDLVREYEAILPNWGVASAPVVYEGLLIALVGGSGDAGVVAFDKRDGKEKWRAPTAAGDPGYAPPILIDAAGVTQLVVWHPRAVHSLDPRSGKAYWKVPFEVGMAMTVATPVFDDDRLLVTSFFDGAMLLDLQADPPGAAKRWHQKGKSEQPAESRGLHGLICTPVLDGERIYGIGSYGEMRGLSAATGERVWQSMEPVGEQARWATGFIVRNGKRYLINNDRGELILARLTPEGYHEIDRARLIEPTSTGGGRREAGAVHWSHPAYANGHVVVRNDREMIRVSLLPPPPPAPL